MGDRTKVNNTTLCGEILSKPTFRLGDTGLRKPYFELGVIRESGYIDKISIQIPKFLIDSIKVGNQIRVNGYIKTFNYIQGERKSLKIFVYSDDIKEEHSKDNIVAFTGAVCKQPVFRYTPKGKFIGELLLAVNNGDNSSYVPCIMWGKVAKEHMDIEIGDKLTVTGRLQSRDYQKEIDGEIITRTVNELSLSNVERLDG